MDHSFSEEILRKVDEQIRRDDRNDLIFAWTATVFGIIVVIPSLAMLFLSALSSILI